MDPIPYATPGRVEPANWWARGGALAATMFWLGFCAVSPSFVGPDRIVVLRLLTLPVAALILGIVGRCLSNRHDNRAGKLALYAACSGLTGIVLCAVMLVPRTDPSVLRHRKECAAHLRHISAGLDLYAYDNNDAPAPDFLTLLTKSDLDPMWFVCPAAPHDKAWGVDRQEVLAKFKSDPNCCSYVYMAPPRPRKQLPANFILAYEPLTYHEDGIHVLTNDGAVTWHPNSAAQHILKCLTAGLNPPPPPPPSR